MTNKKYKTEEGFSYVANEEHYTQVFRRMAEVKSSLKIATLCQVTGP